MQNARQVFFADEHLITLFEGKYIPFIDYKLRFYGVETRFCLYIFIPGLFYFLVYQ